MTTEFFKAVFKAAQASDNLDVMYVDSCASDNAADTIGNRFIRGNFDAEFLGYWHGSVQTLLASDDTVTQYAKDFFISHGVRF